MAIYKFDQTARAERYFTSLIFPHLLMSNDYNLLKQLFSEVFNKDFNKLSQYDVEVVCELDPLRDGGVASHEVKKLYRAFKRVAVPDLFLRINDYILIIEAKFFTHPVDDELHDQVNAQKSAIDKVLKYTHYTKSHIHFCLLTTMPVKKPVKDIIYLTWDKVINTIKSSTLPLHLTDLQYSFEILESSFLRAKTELSKQDKIFYEKLKFKELIDSLPKLICKDAVYVGFSGGEKELQTTTLEQIEKRSHYKVSSKKHGENWLSPDKLLGRYFLLKYEE